MKIISPEKQIKEKISIEVLYSSSTTEDYPVVQLEGKRHER